MKLKTEKNSDLNGIRAHDFCDTLQITAASNHVFIFPLVKQCLEMCLVRRPIAFLVRQVNIFLKGKKAWKATRLSFSEQIDYFLAVLRFPSGN